MMLFLMQKANYPHLSSTGELSQEEGTPDGKNENDTLSLPKKTALLADPQLKCKGLIDEPAEGIITVTQLTERCPAFR